ncbi:mandelate racemase [Meridianimarinicoccus roseus]|uniref:Mandelate racemase n=1 Tax=Meridianimarinicoccus roseus TaxID=2072018 RepID=A0A2V2LFM1_9RHOB|nr:enolase C-terminal domain-like protein [Meridianimarinicoccus roseus]PWR04245.1 mandelate racemase [Meridianimarinicoccus roseus]
MTTLRILSANWTERAVAMRLPFQFGSTEVWHAPEAHLRVLVEQDGVACAGRSAQLMVPRWFDKRPDLTNEDTIEELRGTVRTACAQAIGRTGPLPALMRDLRTDVANDLAGVPALATGFGCALLEMAIIDALCAAADLPFWQAARDDLFGLAAHVPDGLAPDDITRALRRIGPPTRIALRHTIGFGAPLRAKDVPPEMRPDALPVSLDEVIASFGMAAFKIKLKGDPQADLSRLRDIAAVISPLGKVSATLDANEQYNPGDFADFAAAFDDDPQLADLRAATRFVEQPFAREIALDTPAGGPLPLVIDESDDGEDAFARALVQGWSGTSIKSCKGVLRALLNKARAEVAGAILSGEDLTCQPGLCWQQDTAMMAACGVPDVERNGHHFAGGLQGAEAAEKRHFLTAHGDIYGGDATRPTLRITQGGIAIASLNVAGFGCATAELPDPAAQDT